MSEEKKMDKQKEPTKAEIKVMLEESEVENKRLENLLLEAKKAQSEKSNGKKEDFSGRDLKPLDLITIVSLCGTKLNLSTEGGGKGKKFKFTKLGERKPILYTDLLGVIENHRSFLEAGYFYIDNKVVVRAHGLDDVYDKILDEERMNEVISCNSDASVNLYSIANERQKKIIDKIIANKLANGEELDLNVLSKLSRSGGKDYEKMADDIKRNREEFKQN